MRTNLFRHPWVLCAAAALAVAWAPAALAEGGFSLHLDRLTIANQYVDVDTDSSKFVEYRDIPSGLVVPELAFSGESADGQRLLKVRLANVRQDDARYGLLYDVAGRYSLAVDYNKIPHRFGNDAHTVYTETSPGRWQLPDGLQNSNQTALTNQFATNPSGITFGFLNGLMAPWLATAQSLDIGLVRNRTALKLDIGKMGNLAWGLQYNQENRSGNRAYGSSFGFGNVTELPEPIDYKTTTTTLSGEWKGANAGAAFGYTYSKFENAVSTMYFDNPFRFTSSTDPSAYSAPGSGSIGGSALGFADLAADNKMNSIFANGRAKFGGWWAHGNVGVSELKQDDALLPYTLNSAIRGINSDGTIFDPTDPANLPARNADRKVRITNLNGDVGTRFGDAFGLTFRYKYYDYDDRSAELSFPGYVRFHAVWEAIPRETDNFSYKKQDAGADFQWDITGSTGLGLSYTREKWNFENRETKSTDEDIVRLSFDTRAIPSLALRASYEYGNRNFSGIYEQEEGNLPQGRKYDTAARKYDLWKLEGEWSASDNLTLTLGLIDRKDDYDKSQFGLLKDDVMTYNAEVDWSVAEASHLYAYGTYADRKVNLRSRQSGSAPSTNPLDDWFVHFKEKNDAWGLGWNSKFGSAWAADLSANYSKSDGEADFTAFPGGLPVTPPRPVLDLPNYEDIKLLAIVLKVDYTISKTAAAGFAYRYEDYTLDSFITQGLTNYLPGTLLLDPNYGDYTANVYQLYFKLKL